MAEIPAFEVKLTAGTAEPLWCDTCMQMSAVKVPCSLIWPDGVTHVGDIIRCFQCHPYIEGEQ